MGETRPSICLAMIVKNEAAVIARSLGSVLPHIDQWIVVDTGSTDGTQGVVRDVMGNLPGDLIERPWVDFAHNRTEALALARSRADFTLVIDADDTLEAPADFSWPILSHDCYTFEIRFDSFRYHRVQMVRNALPWRYRGVLHEFLHCDAAHSCADLRLAIRIHTDGARRRSADTFRRDIDVLERALATESDPLLRRRYTFYLAQSCRDAGDVANALKWYRARAMMGGWQEEVFVSLYQIAKLLEGGAASDDDVLTAYALAADAAPERVEALHAASRFCRLRGRHREGYELARRGLGKPIPDGALFSESWIYAYGLRDEYAVNAYWCGAYRDCLEACLDILDAGEPPPADRARVAANARFALRQLGLTRAR